jgi:thiamine biosynthesis protein ThiS
MCHLVGAFRESQDLMNSEEVKNHQDPRQKTSVTISVNGEQKDYKGPLTIGGLLQSLGINPRSVAVERNLKIVARAELELEPIADGDVIEIIRLVGGG